MRAYSMDLRERVLAAVDRSTPRKEIVRTLGVSEPTIRRYPLVEAIGQALDAVTHRDALGWFAHCGYRLTDQLA
jgi:hypothetical protein